MVKKNTKPVKVKHAVVLINFGDPADTIDCVHSIQHCIEAPHIIVVDNGSEEADRENLKKNVPGLDLVAGENVGFSEGNNRGIKRALKLGAKVIYILNNDTVVDPHLFARAYRYVAGRKRIAGGKIYYAKGHEFHAHQKGAGNIIWYAGGSLDWSIGIARHTGVDEVDSGQYDRVQNVGFITGCFMALPRQVVHTVGMFDPSFFLYLEDAEYCMRASGKGVELKYNPALVVYHKNSAASGVGSARVDYYMTRNRFVLARRYGSWRLRFALLREALTRNWKSRIRRQAYMDYLRGKMGNRNDAISKIS